MKEQKYLFNKKTRMEYLTLAERARISELPTVEKAWKLLADKRKCIKT